MGRVQIE